MHPLGAGGWSGAKKALGYSFGVRGCSQAKNPISLKNAQPTRSLPFLPLEKAISSLGAEPARTGGCSGASFLPLKKANSSSGVPT